MNGSLLLQWHTFLITCILSGKRVNNNRLYCHIIVQFLCSFLMNTLRAANLRLFQYIYLILNAMAPTIRVNMRKIKILNPVLVNKQSSNFLHIASI